MITSKVAVVGCGHWGKNLARNFSELGALKAVVDPNPNTAEHYASQLGVEAKDFASVLADNLIEGVVIAAPAEFHFDLAIKTISAGKHVFVEKPLALSVSEGDDIRSRAKSAGVIIMVGHLLQYHAKFIKLKELVRNGVIGKIQYAYSHRLSMGKFRLKEDAYWSLAPHDISMILSLFDEHPINIRGSGSDFITPGIVDEARVDLKFPSGGRAHIFTSWLHPFKEQRLVIVGEKGALVFEDSNTNWDKKLALYKHRIAFENGIPTPEKSDVQFIDAPFSEPLKSECKHFLECISTGSIPITNADEALSVLRVLEAPDLPRQ